MSMIRSWSSTAYYDHTPSTAGTWRYRVQIQRTENGQAVGDVVSADTYVSVLAPLSNLQLQSPAASATVNGDNGVTFTWTAFESTARYDFCLSKFDYLPCASNSDSILRGNLSSASVTLARTDLTGFTGIPLWWAVKVRRGTQQQTTAGRAVTINTTGPVPLQWTWTTRLTQEHFTAAGATLNQEQINRLTAATISLNSIFNSTTNRVYDNKKCNECHDGTSGQMAPKYRPTTSMSKSTAHRKNKTDGSTTSTYRWDNSSDAGVVRAFKNTWYDKPEILEKLFQKWLDMGAQ
jgi:hypothetical protein